MNLSSTCKHSLRWNVLRWTHSIIFHLPFPTRMAYFLEMTTSAKAWNMETYTNGLQGFKDNLSALLKPPVGNSKLTAQMTHQLLSNFQKVKKGLIYVMVDSTPVISTFCCCHSIQKVIPIFTLTDQENHNRCLNSDLWSMLWIVKNSRLQHVAMLQFHKNW